MNEDGFQVLEAQLTARAAVQPEAALRGRVLEALGLEVRREARASVLVAVVAWLVVLATWLASEARGPKEPEAVDVRDMDAWLERGPDLALLPRLARPIGSLGGPVP
jgi:hypothetical protein